MPLGRGIDSLLGSHHEHGSRLAKGCTPYPEIVAQLRVQAETAIDGDGYRPIVLEVSPQVLEVFRQLHRTGLYGLTLEGVAEEALRKFVREAIAAGWTKRQARPRGRR